MSHNRLILVDGTAALYRAYFAIPELTGPSGVPTNAVFGFVRMLRQLESRWSPTHWAVTFDGGRCKRRLAWHAEYKAQRPRMQEAMALQIPFIEDYLDRAGVVRLRLEHEEADDVMATLCRRFEAQSEETLIATSDKDMFQLIGPACRMIPLSGKGDAMDAEAVRRKTGVLPEQIVDWLSLVGDSADNIPGVPGVGPKTAASLLAQYESLDNMWKDLSGIKQESLRKKLVACREVLALNRRLIQLEDQLPCQVTWQDLAVRPQDSNRLLPFFQSLGLDSFANELRQTELFS